MSNIKECFREYPLQDQVDALKNILVYNEKYVQRQMFDKSAKREIKDLIGVKECLQAEQKTPFQILISELKNTTMKSYWDKEVGKTKYQVPNLPVGLDPLKATFGVETKSKETVAKLLTSPEAQEDSIPERFPKPAEQINRKYERINILYKYRLKEEYKEPFSKCFRFGKRTNVDVNGTRAKRLLTWINQDPVSMVNRVQADFVSRTRTPVGEARNTCGEDKDPGKVYGRIIKKERNAFSDCSVGSDIILQQKRLQHLNTLRQRLKKRFPEVPFLDIYEELTFLDQKFEDVLPEKIVFLTLEKYKIYVDKEHLSPLLDALEICKEGNVNYKKLIDLLNWKSDFPTLPKFDALFPRCQNYISTYNEDICSAPKPEVESVRAAGIPSCRWDLPVAVAPPGGMRADRENLGDQTSAYSLISPSIFTRHGLNHLDFFKVREKEEIRDIFKNIGVEFSDAEFDALWEKGLQADNAAGVSVETFRKLVS